MNQISGFNFCDSSLGCAHVFLLPAVLNILKKIDTKKLRIFDLGCGNGMLAKVVNFRHAQALTWPHLLVC
jgi:2-polyprenyl-3-methyl-5-hydroxy-6-metoxy-1,4-benzoquinol methylase